MLLVVPQNPVRGEVLMQLEEQVQLVVESLNPLKNGGGLFGQVFLVVETNLPCHQTTPSM